MSWYRMHRGWMDDRLWSRDKYSKREAWCWIIENAMFEDYEYFIKGKTVTVKKGSLIFTERQLANKWKWGRQKVRTFLKHLQNDQKIVLNITQGITQISVMNYVTYQDQQPKNKPSRNPRITQEQPTTEEGKEGKEGKEKNRGSRISENWEPSSDLVNQISLKEKSNIGWVEDQTYSFVNYWIAKSGKDATKLNWDATFRNWCAKSYNKPEQSKHMENSFDFNEEETDEIKATITRPKRKTL